MERLCEVTVEIGGHRKVREKEIIKACMVEWSFREDDFFHRPSDDGRHQILEASALGTLYADDDEQEIIGRLERAVWRVNGGMCHVEVRTVLVRRSGWHVPVNEEELQIA